MAAIYHVSDLIPQTILPSLYRSAPTECVEVVERPRYGPGGADTGLRVWQVVAVGESFRNFTAELDHEPGAAEVARAIRPSCRRIPEPGWVPFLSAEALGAKVRARRRLTAEQLLADGEFARLARQAAKAGKSYTAELLEYEAKPVVAAAVAVVRAEVDAERAAEAERRAAVEAERRAKLADEWPTREAVLDAYEECGYRVCKQGHGALVEIGDRAGCRSDVFRGEEYSTRCSFRKQDSRHVLRVRRDWLATVRDRGLATFGGRLTLSARLVGAAADGRAVYELLQVKQGRGTAIETAVARTGEAATEFADPRILRDWFLDAGRADLAEQVEATTN